MASSHLAYSHNSMRFLSAHGCSKIGNGKILLCCTHALSLTYTHTVEGQSGLPFLTHTHTHMHVSTLLLLGRGHLFGKHIMSATRKVWLSAVVSQISLTTVCLNIYIVLIHFTISQSSYLPHRSVSSNICNRRCYNLS